MTVAWQQFTPGSALAGGLLIGLAASLCMLLNGRIAGISGILGGLLKPVAGDTVWRLAFILGLVAAPVLFGLVATLPKPQIDGSFGVLVLAGLLVGFGTRLGSGCTSGHGVCGLARGSLRSAVATAAFMSTGFASVYIVRHVLAS